MKQSELQPGDFFRRNDVVRQVLDVDDRVSDVVYVPRRPQFLVHFREGSFGNGQVHWMRDASLVSRHFFRHAGDPVRQEQIAPHLDQMNRAYEEDQNRRRQAVNDAQKRAIRLASDEELLAEIARRFREAKEKEADLWKRILEHECSED